MWYLRVLLHDDSECLHEDCDDHMSIKNIRTYLASVNVTGVYVTVCGHEFTKEFLQFFMENEYGKCPEEHCDEMIDESVLLQHNL